MFSANAGDICLGSRLERMFPKVEERESSFPQFRGVDAE